MLLVPQVCCHLKKEWISGGVMSHLNMIIELLLPHVTNIKEMITPPYLNTQINRSEPRYGIWLKKPRLHSRLIVDNVQPLSVLE